MSEIKERSGPDRCIEDVTFTTLPAASVDGDLPPSAPPDLDVPVLDGAASESQTPFDFEHDVDVVMSALRPPSVTDLAERAQAAAGLSVEGVLFSLQDRAGGVFAGPEPIFGTGAVPAVPVYAPVLDDGAETLGVGSVPIPPQDEVYGGVKRHSAIADDTEPLVKRAADEDDSSTPLYMRETSISQSICRHCRHGWETTSVLPVTSRTYTPLATTIVCCFVKPARNVTDDTILHCSRYRRDKQIDPTQLETAEARKERLRAEFGLTTPTRRSGQ